jgi:thiamine kinase-like enzyme
MTALEKLDSAVEDGRILPEHYNTLFESTQLAILELEAAPGPENRIGIIHGDMMPGNLLQAGPDIWIIDFDNSGIGDFAQDIAWVLTQLTPENRRVFVNTYASVRRKGSPTQRELELHFILSQIYSSSWWVNDPGHKFSSIPNLCELCRKLKHGRSFLYT